MRTTKTYPYNEAAALHNHLKEPNSIIHTKLIDYILMLHCENLGQAFDLNVSKGIVSKVRFCNQIRGKNQHNLVLTATEKLENFATFFPIIFDFKCKRLFSRHF